MFDQKDNSEDMRLPLEPRPWLMVAQHQRCDIGMDASCTSGQRGVAVPFGREDFRPTYGAVQDVRL